MREEGSTIELGPRVRTHVRVLHGIRKPGNWLQLVRFGLVGGVGFAVNLLVYAVLVHPLGVYYLAASVAAWFVAVLNNFVLNRHWTFDAGGVRARGQAIRFLAVSALAEVVSLSLLKLLVDGAGLEKVAAQALAVGTVMPLNFIGNKLWTFRESSSR
jgi:putative flippase GtrA